MDNNDYISYYNDDYHYDNNEYQYESNKKNSNNKGKFLYVVLAIIAIILIFILLVSSCNRSGNGGTENVNPLVLDYNSYNLEIDETAKINAAVTNGDNNALITWSSSDSKIVAVENGVITALNEGVAIITATYIVNEQTYTQQCTVNVTAKPGTPSNPPSPPTNPPGNSDNTKPSLETTITSGAKEWYASDVSIKVSASDASGISNIKYAINCTNNCNYINVSNNGTFKITTNGTNIVTIIATDKNGNQTTKNVTVKIDKTAPLAKLNISGTTVYNNTGSVQVCAACTDTESGCSQTQVCKTYTTNQNNVTIEVTDKANNKATSNPFNIIIDKAAPTCSLMLNVNTGELTGTAIDTGGSGIAYSGYNASYSGTNATKKAGVLGINNYYVKDNAGNTGKCSITLSLGYRSRACYEKDYTWTLTNSKICGDGFKNRSKEDAIANGRLWYRSDCRVASDSEVNTSKYPLCTDPDSCKCCKEYTRSGEGGCKTFEGSSWSDWSTTPIQSDEYTQVETKLIVK